MERLSEQLREDIYELVSSMSEAEETRLNRTIDYFIAYEDTGLTPEEIKSLLAEWKVNLMCLDNYRKAEANGRLVILQESEEELPDIGTLCLVKIDPDIAPVFWTVAEYVGEGEWETDSDGIWPGESVLLWAVLKNSENTIQHIAEKQKRWIPTIIRGEPGYVCPHCGSSSGTLYADPFCSMCGNACEDPGRFEDTFEHGADGKWKVRLEKEDNSNK